MLMDDDEDLSKRLEDPPAASQALRAIEVTFEIPTYVTRDQWERLRNLVHEIIESPCNTPSEGVHWLASEGSKPNWSQADRRMLGLPGDPAAPEHGEPTFDDSIQTLSSAARSFASEQERERVLRRRRAH
jgi:hypothetical protein